MPPINRMTLCVPNDQGKSMSILRSEAEKAKVTPSTFIWSLIYRHVQKIYVPKTYKNGSSQQTSKVRTEKKLGGNTRKDH